jgi:hypothetical protein
MVGVARPVGTTAAPQLSQKQEIELGEYIIKDSELLDAVGWDRFVDIKRGKPDLTIRGAIRAHPASHMLGRLQRSGAPVVLHTAPWSHARQTSTMKRGPHKSAHEFAEFLKDELAEFIRQGQWVVLPFRQLLGDRNLRMHLRISPMGVVPQRDRRPCIIVDYSFFDVNNETVRLAPDEAMQFGKALERVMHDIVSANPLYGPVHLMKVDIADGFYRIMVRSRDIVKLAVSIPTLAGEEPLVALPLVLPMGWTQSPPWFCAATETATDVANQRLQRKWKAPPHRLDTLASTPPASVVPTPLAAPVDYTPVPEAIPPRTWKRQPLERFDVFVDDFIGTAQGSKARLNNTRRVLFHTLDELFRPLEANDQEYRREPASTKKLGKGDGHWETRKIILGWILDSIRMTIELPPHRITRLQDLLDSVPLGQKRTSVKKWQQLLGELRSMAIALPGARGLFSLLQEALRHQADRRIRLNAGIHDCLEDFRWLLTDLGGRPTRFFEIVPQSKPELLGACDASGLGMGGVWFASSTTLPGRTAIHGCEGESSGGPERSPLQPGTTQLPPILWRAQFPPDISARLVSDHNPTGDITNSDLELAASIITKDIAAQHFDIRERTISNGSDNTPTVYWQRKGSTTTTSAPAYLLRAQALHQRYHRYNSSEYYIPGPANSMADDASRLLSLSSHQLVSHFNRTYPQPTPWVFASLLQVPTPRIALGSAGAPFVSTSASIPGSLQWGTLSSSFRSLPTAIARASLRPAAGPCDLALWSQPSARSVRRWPVWGPRTPESVMTAKPNSGLAANSARTPRRMLRRPE